MLTFYVVTGALIVAFVAMAVMPINWNDPGAPP